VTVSGQVFDGAGAPVTDAVLEFWQADPAGRFPPATDPGWSGFTRVLTDESGGYRICTLKPGALPLGARGVEAPHVDVSIFARGLMQRLVTRFYFSDDSEIEADPLLSSISDADVREGLIAGRGPDGYHLDMWLQGDKETTFFVP
jgi:protocatechuate 3,4-dioxygenase alpha subunit